MFTWTPCIREAFLPACGLGFAWDALASARLFCPLAGWCLLGTPRIHEAFLPACGPREAATNAVQSACAELHPRPLQRAGSSLFVVPDRRRRIRDPLAQQHVLRSVEGRVGPGSTAEATMEWDSSFSELGSGSRGPQAGKPSARMQAKEEHHFRMAPLRENLSRQRAFYCGM